MTSKLTKWIRPLPYAPNPIKNEQEISKKYKYWRIRMFLGMYVGYLMYYFVRKNIPYVGSFFIDDLHLTKLDFGIIGSSMAVTYAIGKFISGLAVDKCSIRFFLAFGLIGSSIINLFFAYLPTLPLLSFFWGLNGIFQSMGFTTCAKGLVHWFSQNERGTIWTLHSSSKMAGITGIGFLSTFFIATGHWKAVFYVPGILGLLVGAALLFVMTDKPECVGLPKIEDFRNDRTLVKVEEKSNLSHWQILSKYIFKNYYLWLVSIAAMALYFVRFTSLDWSTIFMKERGISPATAASLLIAMPIVGIFGGISAGYLADKAFKGRCVPISIIYLVFLVVSLWAMYAFVSVTTPWWIIAFILAAVGFFVEGPQSVAMGALIGRLSPKEAIGAAIGFVGIFEYIGTFFAGVIAAIIITEYSWKGLFTGCCLSAILTIMLLALISKKDRLILEESKEHA